MRNLFAILAIVAGWQLAPARAATLRVLTYNIHHGVGNDSVLSLNRIANVILAANPDLVSLQEVDHGVPRSNDVEQVHRLAELTGMIGYFGKARNLDGGAYGNGVLVKPGIDVVSTINRALPNPDPVEPRALLELNLSVDANPATTEFKFFATHLHHNSGAGRTASVNFINDLVSGSAVPSILAGDLNIQPSYTAYDLLMEEWTDVTNINNSGKNRANQIDYIFLRSEAQWNIVTRSQFIVNSTTNVASDHHPLLAVVELPVAVETLLVWNNNSGAAAAFTDGFATGDGSQGVGVFPASPWDSPYNTGVQQLVVGYNGVATFSGSGSRTIGLLRVGTDQAHAVIAGRNGNGSVNASGSVNLTLSSTSDSAGDLLVGEGGYVGAMTWSSSGTLEAQGRLRIGQGGVGTFNQAAGVVIGGSMPGSFRYVGIGVDAGSTGAYNLDGGFLRPSGGFGGSEFRQTLVGDNAATGSLNVGNNIGAANTAVVESNDDLIVGRNGGTGVLRVRSDGRVELRTSANQAELLIGQNGDGSVIQTGGLVATDSLVRIGGGSAGVGQYTISGGELNTAADGGGTFQIASDGAVGTLHVSDTGGVEHGAELFIAHQDGTGGTGRLEIVGSAASIQIGQLENAVGGALGMSETIFWQADSGGVAPLVVAGTGPAANHLQLQDPAEASANTGSGATLSGDGIALSLNLTALAGNQTLTLIDNRSTQAVSGFFENGSTESLYAEGAQVLGTGFVGTVTISYIGSSGIGSTGNDVVLNLVAPVVENADFDEDGDVDGVDFLTWQRNVGTTSGASSEEGDANDDGDVDGDDLEVWTGQFATASSTALAPAPEPSGIAIAFIILAFGGVFARRWRR